MSKADAEHECYRRLESLLSCTWNEHFILYMHYIVETPLFDRADRGLAFLLARSFLRESYGGSLYMFRRFVGHSTLCAGLLIHSCGVSLPLISGSASGPLDIKHRMVGPTRSQSASKDLAHRVGCAWLLTELGFIEFLWLDGIEFSENPMSPENVRAAGIVP